MSELINTDPAYDLKIFRKNPNLRGRYTGRQKVFTLFLLEGNQKEHGGIPTPRFTHYSQQLDIPIQTLREWWKRKDLIIKENQAVANAIMKDVQFQMVSALPKIMDKLDARIDSDDIKNSDLINYMREVINKLRLLNNQSTQNTEVNVNHFSPVPTKSQVK